MKAVTCSTMSWRTLIAEEAAPTFEAVAFPRILTGAVFAAGIWQAFVAQSSSPANPAPASTSHLPVTSFVFLSALIIPRGTIPRQEYQRAPPNSYGSGNTVRSIAGVRGFAPVVQDLSWILKRASPDTGTVCHQRRRSATEYFQTKTEKHFFSQRRILSGPAVVSLWLLRRDDKCQELLACLLVYLLNYLLTYLLAFYIL